MVKELRLVFRSPTVFMNCVLIAFIMPIILGASFIPLMNSGELTEIIDLIDFTNPRVASMALVAMCAIGLFMGGMASVAATAISREGNNFFIMKYLPVSYSTQLNAKAVSGLIILLPAFLFMIIPIQIVLGAPIWLFACGVLLALPGMVIVNYLGLYIDLVRPKLTWDNEQAAVKQNLNSMIPMFGSWVVAGVVGIVGWQLTRFVGPIAVFIGLFGVMWLMAFGAYTLVISKGATLMGRLH